MKLKYEFETVEIGDEITAVPVGDNSSEFNGVLQMNDIGAKMLKYISESETPEEVHKKLCADYPDEDRNQIGQDLCKFLNKLVAEGVLIP